MDWMKALFQKFPWLMISTGIVLSIAALVSLIVVGNEETKREEAPQSVTVKARVEKPPEEIVQPPEEIERKSIPKNVESELVSYEEETFVVPEEMPDPDQDLHLNIGDPEGVDNLPAGATGGTSAGVGTGGHFGSGVSTFASRRVGAGGKGRRTGVTQGTELSVLEGLRWLVRHQNPDGSWAANSLNEVCTQGSPCWPPTLDGNGKEIPRTNHYDEGLTSLALLAFLGAGYGHDSRVKVVDTQMGKAYTLGDQVKKGLQWLRDRQNEDGSFSKERFMYNEVLAAMALTEAYGLTQARAWKEPAQKAIDFIVAAQKKNPNGSGLWGWRYHARSIIEERKERGEIDDNEYAQLIYDADTSVTTWAVMALKSAQLSGLKVPEESMDGANAFIRFVTPRGKGDSSSAAAGNQTGAPRDTGSYNGLVGYLDAARAGEKVTGPRDMFTYYPEAMSSLGMCSRIFINHDHSDPFLRSAADRISKKPPTAKEKLNIDYYYWYYGTLALNQYDGPDSPNKGRGGYWDKWNKAMNDAILELQDKTETKDICNRGGWLTLDRWSYSGGPIYTTAVNVLTLEVYYRFENAFGSGAPKKEAKPK